MGAHNRRAGTHAPVRAAVAIAVVVAAGLLTMGISAAAESPQPLPTPAPPAAGSHRPGLLPGLLGPAPTSSRATPPPAPADPPPVQVLPAAVPAPGPNALVPGTPCTVTALACVDLDRRVSWLFQNGAVIRGPVPVMAGDQDAPTPRGTFRVQWKAAEYTSREYFTQMPYAVFFADGGIAFHAGRQDTYSAGCVKLNLEDAVAWFGYLQVGDQVQVR